MNSTKKYLFLFLSGALLFPCYFVYCANALGGNILADQFRSQSFNKKKKRKKGKRDIVFSFKEEELVDVINFLSAKKRVNIVLPQGPNAITSKLTFSLDHKVSLDEAWDMLYTILDIAGYTLIQEENSYVVIKTQKDKKAAREPLPIYIGVPLNELPDSDKRIRYLHFLSNLNAKSDELKEILVQALPANAYFAGDESTNAIIIVGKANDIKGVMEIVTILDQAEFKETVEFIKLRYFTANEVANIVNKMIRPEGTRRRYPLGRPPAHPTYFSPNLRIVPEPRTNSLIIMGKAQAVARMKNFIYKYIDVELEEGKSVLHIYKLQYLDAKRFEPVLKTIVQAQAAASTGQAEGATTTQVGTERFFQNVVITSDAPEDDQRVTGEGAERQISQTYWGGNKLIIAASQEDWERLKDLIEKLDTPQPQVIIQVLIADLTLDDTRKIASQIRNPVELPFPKNVDAQAAHINQVIVGECGDPVTLQEDLLKINSLQVPVCPDSEPNTIANNIEPGSTLIEVNDPNGETWGLLQLLKLLDHTKIISHPHVIATNNQMARIVLEESRLLPSGSSGSVGGTVNVPREFVPAKLEVEITPRISAVADTVNMHVRVSIEQFLEAFVDINASNDKSSRIVHTIADVGNGAILALGGLSRIDTTQSNTDTPLLSRIPILGYFFKSRNVSATETNLSVFISPIIIKPRLRGGVGQYTKDHIEIAKNYSRESYGSYLFTKLRDPITHFFFRPTEDTGYEKIEEFAAKDEFKREEFLDPDEVAEEEGRILIANNKINKTQPDKSKKRDITLFAKEKDLQIKTLEKTLPKATTQIAEVQKTVRPIDREEQLKQLLNTTVNPFLNT